LRIYLDEGTSASKECGVLVQLHKRSVPVPEILHTNMANNDFEWRCIITSWIDGRDFESVIAGGSSEITKRAAHACGKSLALLKRFARWEIPSNLEEELSITGRLDSHVPDILIDMLSGSHLVRRLGRESADKAIAFVRENAEYLPSSDERTMLVHGDFMPHNLLISNAHGDPTAWMIDWEFAHFGSPIADIGAMLRSIDNSRYFYEEDFINGYRENGGRIPKEWRQMARMSDLLILCKILNQEADRPDAHDRIKGIVMRTISGNPGQNW
jgi:aminoglycoside phosphotransferase (APT) family kinase protein